MVAKIHIKFFATIIYLDFRTLNISFTNRNLNYNSYPGCFRKSRNRS